MFMNNKPMFDAISMEVISHLVEGARGSILDLASGPGEPSVTLGTMGNAPWTKNRIGRIVSTDFQEEMIKKARARAETAGVSSDVEKDLHLEYVAPVSSDVEKDLHLEYVAP